MSQPLERDDVLESTPPAASTAQVADLLQRRFGLSGPVRALSSERDGNFRVDTSAGTYLLKITNSAEDPRVTDLQTAALRHLERESPSLPVPRLIAALDGTDQPREVLSGRTHIVRLMSFLPGGPMGTSTSSFAIRSAIGETLARLDVGLSRFDHPASEHDLLWNAADALRARAVIRFVDDPMKRRLAETTLDEYEKYATPVMPMLRKQVIHNDLNLASVGHCHPRVVAAICEQAAVLNTHTRYLHEAIVEYAERLLATFPNELGNVMFTCTGSESNDLAIRIARSYTGAEGFIVTSLAYHGITDAVSKLSPSLGPNVPRGPFVRTVDAPDLYRSKTLDVGAEFASHVRAAIADLRGQGIRVAALICDTIFSSDGILAEPPGCLREAVEVVRSEGGLFIADEVQAGFGRTGEGMWGFQRHEVVPDIVTMGKPMGNGHPIAGVVVKPEVVEEFGRTARYFNTFGGNPVACAAALATLNVIEDENLVENARVVGNYLRQRLEELAVKHEKIRRREGLGPLYWPGARQGSRGKRTGCRISRPYCQFRPPCGRVDQRHRSRRQCLENPTTPRFQERAC